MQAFTPRREDLPGEFPVFPLTGALLLPQGRLPLNIFEPRYLAMVEDALAGGRMIGMIQPDPNSPGQDGGPGLYRMGCLGRLSSFAESGDGRYLITLTGVIRFAIHEEVATHRGYRRVRGGYDSWWHDLDETAAPGRIPRAEIIVALRAYFQARGFEGDWTAIGEMPDDGLVTTLCMVCPFSPIEKQALLEADDLAERSRVLLTLLRIDAAGDQAPGVPS